jgi:hypothetical protein
MAISIGQLNSYLKNYTDALLTLHGIPITDYSHEVSSENMMAEFTARKTLETAMWNLCQHAEAQAETLAFELQQIQTKRNFQKKLDEVNKALRHQERHEAKMKEYELVDAIRELRDHIITPSDTAEESAERYLKIVKYAKKTLAPYRDYDENYVHPEDVDDEDSDDEEETDEEQTDEEETDEEEEAKGDEEMEIARLNAEVGWKCVKCGPKSEDEDFAYHEVKYHQSHGTLCLKCYRRAVKATA